MLCPKDKTAMRQFKANTLYVDMCPVCNGVWFDGGELGRITQGFEIGKFPDLFEKWKGELQKRERRVDFWKESLRKCPKDYSTMKKHFYAGDTDVGIDNCTLCNGFWIDGGELQQIWEYNRPSPNKDIIASGLYSILESADNVEDKIRQDLANMGLLITNPKAWVFYALTQVVRTMIEELSSEESVK